MSPPVAPPPLEHRDPLAGEKDFAQVPVGLEAAEGGDGGDGRVGVGQKRADLLEADVQDFVEHRMAHGLAEAEVEKAARDAGCGDDIPCRQPIAGLPANPLHGLEDEVHS